MGIDAKMLVRVTRAVDADTIRHESVKLVAAFGREDFFLMRERDQHALERVDVYDQDGPEIVPREGETLIRVHLWSRYYGPGYERGPIVKYIAIARWLSEAFAPCEVWYGGDSSGVLARPFNAEAMWRHFRSDEGRAYFDHRNPYITDPPSPLCSFCAGRESTPCGWNMGAKKATLYVCHGCDSAWFVAPDLSVTPAVRTPNDGWREAIVQVPTITE